MKRTILIVIGLAAALLPGRAMAQPQNPDVQALINQVKNKPAIEREDAKVTVDVVAYELQRHPKLQNTFKAVAAAGGGTYSDAQIKDIGQVMQSVVSGQATPTPASGRSSSWRGRLEKGETIITHGIPDLED